MDWNKEKLKGLHRIMAEAFINMQGSRKTDRKNMSELWNRRLELVGAKVVRHRHVKQGYVSSLMVSRLVEIINSGPLDSLCVPNPDRSGQYILVPRDMAEKILVMGLP